MVKVDTNDQGQLQTESKHVKFTQFQLVDILASSIEVIACFQV